MLRQVFNANKFKKIVPTKLSPISVQTRKFTGVPSLKFRFPVLWRTSVRNMNHVISTAATSPTGTAAFTPPLSMSDIAPVQNISSMKCRFRMYLVYVLTFYSVEIYAQKKVKNMNAEDKGKMLSVLYWPKSDTVQLKHCSYLRTVWTIFKKYSTFTRHRVSVWLRPGIRSATYLQHWWRSNSVSAVLTCTYDVALIHARVWPIW